MKSKCDQDYKTNNDNTIEIDDELKRIRNYKEIVTNIPNKRANIYMFL